MAVGCLDKLGGIAKPLAHTGRKSVSPDFCRTAYGESGDGVRRPILMRYCVCVWGEGGGARAAVCVGRRGQGGGLQQSIWRVKTGRNTHARTHARTHTHTHSSRLISEENISGRADADTPIWPTCTCCN